MLPCLLWQTGARPWVLLEIDGAEALILDPAGAAVPRRLSLTEVQARIEPFVILLTPDDRAGPDPVAAPADWFWSAVRECRGAWAQVIIASLLMNLMALALPLFIMNVYDKVIPNLSFVTLWTLSIGVLIALGLDLVLRLLRHHVLDTISRRVDLVAGAALFKHALGIGLLDRPGGAGGLASHLGDYEPVREFFAAASFTAFVDLLFIGVFIGAMFLIVGPLGWVPLVAVVVVLSLAMIARLPMRHAAKGVIQLAARRNRVKAEALDGAETVKTLGAE
ncbi:MAG: type I secretion system permease/ATPase, partial [Rhodobacteraceae bacterium]|nr:type I secretion system permease/ATPase [Paracoccaceae bacterium]